MIEKTTEKRCLEQYLYSFEIRGAITSSFEKWIYEENYIHVELVPIGKAFKNCSDKIFDIAFDMTDVLPDGFGCRGSLKNALYPLLVLYGNKNGVIRIDLGSFIYSSLIQAIEEAVEELDKKYNNYDTVLVLYLDPKSKYFEFTGITTEEWELGL